MCMKMKLLASEYATELHQKCPRAIYYADFPNYYSRVPIELSLIKIKLKQRRCCTA